MLYLRSFRRGQGQGFQNEPTKKKIINDSSQICLPFFSLFFYLFLCYSSVRFEFFNSFMRQRHKLEQLRYVIICTVVFRCWGLWPQVHIATGSSATLSVYHTQLCIHFMLHHSGALFLIKSSFSSLFPMIYRPTLFAKVEKYYYYIFASLALSERRHTLFM
jgi:hypothetical protein